MPLASFFRNARTQICILGTNPLAPFLEKSAGFFASRLSENPGLSLTILYESDSENFGQALVFNTHFPEIPEKPRISSSKIPGLAEEIKSAVSQPISGETPEKLSRKSGERILVRQFNLRLPVNIIRADERLWYCITTHTPPSIDSYLEVSSESRLYAELLSYLDSVTDPEKGGSLFLSKPGEELIEAYDRKGIPRGILPRKAFYTREFQGYAIWAFVFNRKGELLLHRRSRHTKDDQLLWDKSVGGHVDLSDRDSSASAKRELIEELFLPEAEYTDPLEASRLRAGLGDIVQLGEWDPKKRQRARKIFGAALKGLGPSDWGLFRALDEKGEPLTLSRASNRRIRRFQEDGTNGCEKNGHEENGCGKYEERSGKYEERSGKDSEEVIRKQSHYLIDIFLVISPPGWLDTPGQMKEKLGPSEKTGAAEDHRLVTVRGLGEWIEETEKRGVSDETFTDDLLYINSEHRELLESFSEFINVLNL